MQTGKKKLVLDHLIVQKMDDESGSKEDVQRAIAELRAALPREGAVNTDPHVLEFYGSSDKSYHPASPHSVVVHPVSTEEVVEVVNVARKYRVPIVPYSGATSLEGHFSGVSASRICAVKAG